MSDHLWLALLIGIVSAAGGVVWWRWRHEVIRDADRMNATGDAIVSLLSAILDELKRRR